VGFWGAVPAFRRWHQLNMHQRTRTFAETGVRVIYFHATFAKTVESIGLHTEPASLTKITGHAAEDTIGKKMPR